MPKGIYKHKKGKIGYWLGKKFSNNHKNKISKSKKGKKPYIMTDEIRNKMSINRKGKSSNAKGKKWDKKSRKNRSGKNNPNWQGGKNKLKRSKHQVDRTYKEWRIAVFQRDSWTCQVCKKVGGELNAHHIKSWANYPKLRYEVSNGITLCIECHKLMRKKSN